MSILLIVLAFIGAHIVSVHAAEIDCYEYPEICESYEEANERSERAVPGPPVGTPSPTGVPSSTGVHRATEDDLPIMRAAGFPNPKVGDLWNPDDPNVGSATGEAKYWLQQHATKDTNISCLNPRFAEKLKNFMEAVPGEPPTITSAYRTVGQQQGIISSGSGATRVKTPCGSYHPWGLAADFNNNGGQQTGWMRANATRYGVRTIGSWDPNHFQDSSGKYGQCGACEGGAGGNGFLPSTGGGGASPTSGVANTIRSLFNPQQQQPTAAPPPSTTAPQQPPKICVPEFTCSDNKLYYRSSSCTTEVRQNCPYGCEGNMCALASTSTSSTFPSSSINIPSETTSEQPSEAPTGTSTIDLINAIAFPSASESEVGTSAPPILNPDTLSQQRALSEAWQGTGEQIPAAGYGYAPLASQQTFTSPDLSDTFPVSTQQPTTLQVTLATMEEVILRALDYLKPFRGYVPGTGMMLE